MITNPSFNLYKNHKENIDISRQLLFSRLHRINPLIKEQIEQLYDDRKSNNKLPYLGELYPWVIADLFGFEKNENIQEISQDWLALYYYTIFTDDVIDSDEKKFEGNEMISLTALMKEGLFKLYKAVVNTPYELEFEKAINSVLDSGKREEELKGEIIANQDKANYSTKKNDLIKLCTYALVSKCIDDINRKEQVLDFTNKLQLCFQYLDDIADLKEDLKDENYTVILNSLLQKISIQNIDEDNLVSLLIEKKVLMNFVSNVVDLIRDINSTISNNANNSSVAYFKHIYKNLGLLHLFLEEIDHNLYKSQDLYKESVIKETEKRIAIVASST